MLKLAVRAQSAQADLAAHLAGMMARRRGLTLVEYVLGAAFVAAIALFLGPLLRGLAGRAWTDINNAFNAGRG
jgi:Flp pilus assembly pilin Flp